MGNHTLLAECPHSTSGKNSPKRKTQCFSSINSALKESPSLLFTTPKNESMDYIWKLKVYLEIIYGVTHVTKGVQGIFQSLKP